jgi:hypothetical protein
MSRLWRLAILLSAVAVLRDVPTASAAAIYFDLDPFTESSADANVTVDDDTPGVFTVTVQIVPESVTGNIGDITGVFFNLSDDVALGDITSVTGGPIIGFANNTNNLGNGVNLNGGGPANPGLFDVGLRYAGFSTDDVQLVVFTIDNPIGAGGTFTLDDFISFGLRLQTVGPAGGSRGGSSKMFGDDPIPVVEEDNEEPIPSSAPEPSTLALAAIGGLSLIAGLRRRRKSHLA